MSYHLRIPGKATYWTVQRYADPGSGRGKEWMSVADCFIAAIPQELRWEKSGHDRHLEPFQSYSASGEAWQATGNYGVSTYKLALRLYNLLTQYNPEQQFRVVLVELSCKVTEIPPTPDITSRVATFEAGR